MKFKNDKLEWKPDEDHDYGFENHHGPAYKKDLMVKIPISKIWEFFKKLRRKNVRR